MLLLLIQVAAGAVAAPPSVSQPLATPAGPCVVREIGRSPLTLPQERQLYVEPNTLVASAGDLLLAGAPSYLWRRTPGSAAQLTRDTAFGAVITRDGRAHLVPWPMTPRPIEDVHAVARDPSGWSVVFSELSAGTDSRRNGPVLRLWLGQLDGQRWMSLEPLPTPLGVHLRSGEASPLVRLGDTLHWAVPIHGLDAPGVVHFTRNSAGWRYEIVRTPFAAYAALAHSDSLGLVLLVVHADSTLPRDRNSLFLYARRPTAKWRRWRKVVPGGREPVHEPVATPMGASSVLTWEAIVADGALQSSHARALVGQPLLGDARPIELDESVAQGLAFVPLVRRRLWIIDHVTTSGDRELRFVTDSARTAVTLSRWRYPFAGPFRAVPTGDDEVLLAGPMRGTTEADAVVVTLLIRVRLTCATR